MIRVYEQIAIDGRKIHTGLMADTVILGDGTDLKTFITKVRKEIQSADAPAPRLTPRLRLVRVVNTVQEARDLAVGYTVIDHQGWITAAGLQHARSRGVYELVRGGWVLGVDPLHNVMVPESEVNVTTPGGTKLKGKLVDTKPVVDSSPWDVEPEKEEPKVKDAEAYLKEAQATLVQRGTERGTEETERAMGRIVRVFNEVTGRNLTEEEGHIFMLSLKLVRSRRGYKEDDYVDLIGYSSLLAEATQKGKSDG